MPLQTKDELFAKSRLGKKYSKVNENVFTKDYVDFLSEAGWRLEKKLLHFTT